jgi:hypothetical protein
MGRRAGVAEAENVHVRLRDGWRMSTWVNQARASTVRLGWRARGAEGDRNGGVVA